MHRVTPPYIFAFCRLRAYFSFAQFVLQRTRRVHIRKVVLCWIPLTATRAAATYRITHKETDKSLVGRAQAEGFVAPLCRNVVVDYAELPTRVPIQYEQARQIYPEYRFAAPILICFRWIQKVS